MAGTDATREATLGGPAIVLVRPQLGENIGAAARAMLNCGLTDLRLVRPRDGWPSARAEAAASGADSVLETARLFDTVEEAIADLAHVYATSARRRDMAKPVVTPRRAAEELRAFSDAGETCGVLFGPERTGLENDHVVLAEALLEVPLNPAFCSLNLAQAVLVVGYEWYQSSDPAEGRSLPTPGARRARSEDVVRFFEHLEEELDSGGFLRPPEKRDGMVRNIRNLFQRAQLTDVEVQTLRGMIRALSGSRQRRPSSQTTGTDS